MQINSSVQQQTYFSEFNKGRVYQMHSPMQKPDSTSFSGIAQKPISRLDKILLGAMKMGKNNPNLLETFISTGLVCAVRPIIILFTPGADKRDKQYAATQSIASGIVTLITGLLIYDPLKDALKKMKSASTTLKLRDATKKLINDSATFAKFETKLNHLIKFLTYPLVAALPMILLISPIMAKLFPKPPKDNKVDKEGK